MWAQNYFGYTNTDYERNGGVRFGSSQTQGQAIRLSDEKLDMLRGKQITGVRTVFGTRNMQSLTFFITSDLNGTPLVSQEISGGSSSWKDFVFDTPYTIGEESELYVGYTLTCETSYNPLQFDHGLGMSNTSFRYNGSEWVDSYSDGNGNACLQIIVDGVEPFTDILVKDLAATGYYLAGQPYVYSGQLFNFGTESINSFDISFRMGDAEEQVYSYDNLNLASNETFDFDLPEYTSQVSGNLPITITVRNINGGEDDEVSDNTTVSDVYVYPADMQRSIVLEGFTGQSCPNCPTGHVSINSALAAFDAAPVVECFHHSGYFPDNFTMLEDMYYLNFFPDPNSTSAPNFMVNRLMNGVSPVGGGNGFAVGDVTRMLEMAAAIQPYVSIGINSEYNEETGVVAGKVSVYTHVLPEGVPALNIFIVQDSIIAEQSSGGSDYAHRYSFRGSLTGPWGRVFELTEGGKTEYSFEYELPDSIYSSYYTDSLGNNPGIGFPTELKHMYFLAFISKSTDNYFDVPIYNATMAKIGESTQTALGIEEDVVENNSAVLVVSGNTVRVNGDFDRIEVYDMSGRLVDSLTAPVYNFTLDNGFYIARIVSGNHVKTQKLAVF